MHVHMTDGNDVYVVLLIRITQVLTCLRYIGISKNAMLIFVSLKLYWSPYVSSTFIISFEQSINILHVNIPVHLLRLHV